MVVNPPSGGLDTPQRSEGAKEMDVRGVAVQARSGWERLVAPKTRNKSPASLTVPSITVSFRINYLIFLYDLKSTSAEIFRFQR
jgi:hypothetical protein